MKEKYFFETKLEIHIMRKILFYDNINIEKIIFHIKDNNKGHENNQKYWAESNIRELCVLLSDHAFFNGRFTKNIEEDKIDSYSYYSILYFIFGKDKKEINLKNNIIKLLIALKKNNLKFSISGFELYDENNCLIKKFF